MSPFLENLLLTACDNFFSLIPQAIPSEAQLKACRLVSHRGERDNHKVFENTFAAFDPVVEKGIWGIELDVRWTKDLVPVVVHDENALRVFGKNFSIAQHTWQECQTHLPQIPSLEALITRYGKRCHLMIELKSENYPDVQQQKRILETLLSTLIPEEDFHIIALDTQLFSYVDFLPASALLPVSTTNAQAFSQQSLLNHWGGITGHYLFMSKALVEKHQEAQQKIGCGFANSKNVLFREIHKEVDWVFTNQALNMQSILNAHLK